MPEAAWSRVSVRIDSSIESEPTKEQVSRALGQASSDERSTHWFADFGGTEDDLARRIEAAEEFLVAHRDRLTEIAKQTVISLDISFTPHGNQDGLAISPELATELARLNACTRIDVYID